jgi:competence protein ComFC
VISLRDRYSSLAKLAELIFFPSRCQICSALLEQPHEKIVCQSCLASMKRSRFCFCLCCGRFFDYLGEPHLCSTCIKSAPPFSRHRSCGRYQGILKDVILLYKYRKYKVLGKRLAIFAHQALGKSEELWEGTEVVVAVPLHPEKKRQRGFNQAGIIAREMARMQGLVFVEDALTKFKMTPAQTSLAAEERRRNVKGVFRLKKRERIEKKTVILVDDVFTTGSTLRECSIVLREGGAKEVRALTLAQA